MFYLIKIILSKKNNSRAEGKFLTKCDRLVCARLITLNLEIKSIL